MICHFGHAGPFNNNGVEGNNGSIETFDLNSSGHKSCQTATGLVASTCAYLSHKCEEGLHALKRSGTSSMFKNLPAFRNADIEKLKKMHPKVAQLIVCVQLPDEWSAEMDQFMTVGADDLSLYERLSEYQRNKRDWKSLATDVFMDLERPMDFYFPSEHFLCEIDRKRELTVPQLRKQVRSHLKRHMLYAEEARWNAHCKRRVERSLQMRLKWPQKRFTIFVWFDFGRE